MKLTTILPLVILVGAFVVGPMFIKSPTGEPIMQPKDWVPEPVQKAAEAARPKLEVYKWTDENGVVQYSDSRPASLADTSVETIEVAETMTLPKTAFTGDKPVDKSATKGPSVAFLPYGSSSERSGGATTGVQGQMDPVGSGPAMNDALAEIGQRFPQFKAMSDAMARGGVAPAATGDAPQ